MEHEIYSSLVGLGIGYCPIYIFSLAVLIIIPEIGLKWRNNCLFLYSGLECNENTGTLYIEFYSSPETTKWLEILVWIIHACLDQYSSEISGCPVRKEASFAKLWQINPDLPIAICGGLMNTYIGTYWFVLDGLYSSSNIDTEGHGHMPRSTWAKK